MNIIASASNSWGIGKDNDLLFHAREDMKYFKETTTGNVVVMGRKTLDSLPGGKPLKDRVNIVLTRNIDFEREGVIAVHSVDELLEEIKKYSSEIFVIGGGEIYNMLLPFCDRAYITRFFADKEADTFLPNLAESKEWQLESESEDMQSGSLTFRFTVYKRI
ncbi:MAG: dihydrofolate reductase [Clostridia bacterium]|nr:dihydrofolate reductase [Clostridia bacterium]